MSHFASTTCNLNELFYQALFDSKEHPTGILLSIYFCIGIILVSFVVNVLSGKYSQVDQAWSIVPLLYAWFVVNDERTLLMALLATVWGCRLTWNFNRRGGYSFPPWKGEEDYRWSYLRRGFMIPWLKNPFLWTIFNFTFICLYQHFLLWLIASPSTVASLVSSSCGKTPLNWLDYVASLLLLTAVVVESVADNQQFAFQAEKYRLIAAGATLTGEYADGYKQSGLFAFVRKPNYACEQCVWISFYLLSVAATQGEQLWNWSGMGWVLLCLLFQGSGWFTESITISKYPKYKEYQKTTPLYIPNPFQLFKSKAD
jgi:steroid 5-alpha reductase family enzyme